MKKILYSVALVAVGLLLCVSCKKDEVYNLSFKAELEQPEGGFTNGESKNYLHNEHFIFWEHEDYIAAIGDDWTYDDTAVCRIGGGYGTRFATFYANSNKFVSEDAVKYAIYPASAFRPEVTEKGSGGENRKTLMYPNVMPYRSAGGDADPDFTFGPNCFPMVADAEATATSANPDDYMGFHSVSGIVRMQLFSSAGEKTVKEIKFEDVGDQYSSQGGVLHYISGRFVIYRIDQYNPYLRPVTSENYNLGSNTDVAQRDITITDINKNVGRPTSKTPLLTFYLPLPAQSNGSGNNLTQYIIKMTVTSTDNKTFSKTFKVDVRRNCLTVLEAIDITEWNIVSTGQTNVYLAGCGTQERPFQIYDVADLKMVRDAFAASPRGTINGQDITANTWFKVVRSDISLTNDNWNMGISGFEGHFYCSSAHPTRFGIENNSHHPVFESILSTGYVDSVTVRGGFNLGTGTNIGDFSPLCKTNAGHMSNCVNQCNITCNNKIAGICLTNNGTLHGCRNEGSLIVNDGENHEVAGICLTNTGTIRACHALSSAQLSGFIVGGLVQSNSGTIVDCYTTISMRNARGSWGCIAYSNSGTIQNCYTMGSLITVDAVGNGIGGICYSNTGSVVRCSNRMTSIKGNTYVGGIVAIMSGTSATVRDCYLDGSDGQITTGLNGVTQVGGIVANLASGTVQNCYNTDRVFSGTSESGSHVGGCVAVVGSSATVQNCYTSFNVDFVSSNSGTISHCFAPKTISGGTDCGVIKCSAIDGSVYISTEGDLYVELNKWVTDQGGGSKFYQWTQGTDNAINHPVFQNGSSSKKKGRR